MGSFIFGPVSSWRLGRSVGIDLLSTKEKTCLFDCIYCQLGMSVHRLMIKRREFVPLAELAKELEAIKNVSADYATFSGMGEPTLASNLGEAIELIRSVLKLPVAVLTNSCLMSNTDVRKELAKADMVIAKLDAPNEEIFQAINRPAGEYSLDEVLQGIQRFRSEYRGKLALQMMFIEANKAYAREMAAIARELLPDEIQINTPLRPCNVKPLSPKVITDIRNEFNSFPRVISVYEAPKLEVAPLNLEETLRRRHFER